MILDHGIVQDGPYKGQYYDSLYLKSFQFPHWRTVWLYDSEQDMKAIRDIPERFLEWR